MIFYVAAASIVVFLFFLFPVTDFDIWWHLAGGQFMLEQWQFPYTDTFSYNAQGADWLPNSWGFTAFSYLGFQLFGLDGLNITKALVSLAIFLVIVWYLHRESLLNLFSLTFVVLLLFSIRDGFSLRPHTFAYLFFVLFVILLFTYKKHRTYKLIGALAVLQFLWVNFHASFLWGLALTAIFLFTDSGILKKKIDRKNIVLGTTIGIASLAHIFYGPTYLVRLVTEYFSETATQIPIREALAPSPETFFAGIGLLIPLSLLLIVYYSIRQKKFDILLGTLFFTIVAFSGARFTRDLVLFLAITTPTFFPALSRQLRQIQWKIPAIPSVVWKASFLLFLLILLVVVKNSVPGIGLGISPFTYPVGATEFIKQENILEKSNGNLYNTYNFGGYLIWANQPHGVFIDGRARPYLGDPFNTYWANFEGGEVWQETQDRYRITAALMTLPHMAQGKIYNTSTPMFPKEEWALIYHDDVSALYVKRMDVFGELIETHEYRILDPQNLDVSYLQTKIQSQEDLDAAFKEIQRGLSLNPDSYRLHFTLAFVYSLVGQEQLMTEQLNRTLEINPRFETARAILNQL